MLNALLFLRDCQIDKLFKFANAAVERSTWIQKFNDGLFCNKFYSEQRN